MLAYVGSSFSHASFVQTFVFAFFGLLMDPLPQQIQALWLRQSVNDCLVSTQRLGHYLLRETARPRSPEPAETATEVLVEEVICGRLVNLCVLY